MQWDAAHGATGYGRDRNQLVTSRLVTDMSSRPVISVPVARMNEQQLNLLLVGEVEKRPILYNFQLPGYSKKHETEKAWVEIGEVVKLTAAECKEKWKNIRAVFVRHMKPPKSGSGTKEKKVYYLSDTLQFTVPYIKALGKPSGNLPHPPLQEEGELPIDAASVVDDLDSETLSLSLPLERSSPSLQPPISSVDNNSGSTAGSSAQREKLFEPSVTKRKRGLQNDAVDKAFLQYFDRKATTSTNNPKDPKTEALKMFLLSLLPDLQKMNDQEVRQFKRRTLDVVDDILSVKSRYTPSLSPSTTLSSHSGLLDVPSEMPQPRTDIFSIKKPQETDNSNISPLANYFSTGYQGDTYH